MSWCSEDCPRWPHYPFYYRD